MKSLASFGTNSSKSTDDDPTMSGYSEVSVEFKASLRQPTARHHSSDSIQGLTVNKLRFSLLDNYGREKEMETIQELLTRAKSPLPEERRGRELLLIRGNSGVGKTALAKSMRSSIIRGGGAFVIGKFDTNTVVDEPYSAILHACSELCHQIQENKNHPPRGEGKAFRLAIEDFIEELGDDVPALLEVIPGLGDLLLVLGSNNPKTTTTKADDDDDEEDRTSSLLQEAKNRFHYQLRKFFRVAGSLFVPLVLVLDDLQWADFASLDLLEVLLSDPQNTNLVVIGCYRSNELTPAHMLNKLIRDIKLRGTSVGGTHSSAAGGGGGAPVVTEIEVGNLDESDTKNMLLDLLLTDEVRAASLAKICHRKTHGNAFFLVQYLNLLHSQSLLEYNFGLTSWIWDEARIQTETRATENVVDLMKQKLLTFSRSTIYLLEVAACLGFSFREETLSNILPGRAAGYN